MLKCEVGNMKWFDVVERWDECERMLARDHSKTVKTAGLRNGWSGPGKATKKYGNSRTSD